MLEQYINCSVEVTYDRYGGSADREARTVKGILAGVDKKDLFIKYVTKEKKKVKTQGFWGVTESEENVKVEHKVFINRQYVISVEILDK